MKKSVSIFCGISVLAANSCAMAAIFRLFSLVEGMENGDPGLAVWLLCLSLCHFGLSIFMMRERHERDIILFCAAFFLMQLIITFLAYGAFSNVVGILAAVCMWLYSYFSCYEIAVKALTAERITKSFDLCSLTLIILLFFCSVKELPPSSVLPLALSVLFCLFALILVRSGEQPKLKGLIMSGTVLLCFGAAAALFIALASGGIKKLIEFLSGTVSAVFRFVIRAIDAFFTFLAGLLPEKQYDMPLPEAEEAVSLGPPPDMSFEMPDAELVISVMIGLGLCIAAAAIIYHIVKGKSFAAVSKAGGERGVRRKRKSVFSGIRRSLIRLFSALAFRIRAAAARNTAAGLFWQIERRSRTKLHGRKESESCREFLVRAEALYPHAAAELQKLAAAMDAMLFGGDAGPDAAEINRMRRAIFTGADKT